MKREDLKGSFDKIGPSKATEQRMLNNILSHSGKEKKMAFNFRKVVPALGLAVVLAGSFLVYDMMAGRDSTPLPGSVKDNFIDAREDAVAPLINQFQMDGRYYIFLSDELRAEYGFSQQINESDIGDRILTITTSVDPSLIGSEVYSYKPAGGEAVVVVKKDELYQLFRFFTFESYNNNQDEDAIEYLKLYGINQAEDIAKVQFIVHSEQSKIEGKTDIRGELVELDEIAQFYSYYSVLKNSSDKYFDRLFNYNSNSSISSGVEIDIAGEYKPVPPNAPGQESTQSNIPSTIDPIPDPMGVAEDLPIIIEENSETDDVNVTRSELRDEPKGMMDMGNAGSTVGATTPSQGSAGNALENPVTIRIYNQSGVYFDTIYYRNIGFISRYEVNEEFADFMQGYIK